MSAPLERALERVHRHLAPTPCRRALGLDPTGRLRLKLETFQPTGAFKVRGAFHKLEALRESGEGLPRGGVVAASTGNHGAAVAYAARALGVPATVIVPEGTGEDRRRLIERFGARVVTAGADCGASEGLARARAAAEGLPFVSPYNDPDVMLGQGTVGSELLEHVDDLARVYVAVGGGGLIGGIGAAIKAARPEVEIVGCSPEASHIMESSVAAGRIVALDESPTLSVATAGSLEEGTVTLAACAAHVDRWLRVPEDAIAASIRDLYRAERVLGEGAAGVALAAWVRDPAGASDGASCVVVCGGNLDEADLARIF